GPQLEMVRDYVACGGSVVALVPPGSAFLKWPQWETEVLGLCSAAKVCGSSGAAIETAPYADGHSILRDVGNLRHGGCVTTLPGVDRHTTALLAARFDQRLEPVAWVRTHGEVRSFFTTLGQPADFQQPAFLQLLANAVAWAIGRPDEALTR
ncbi:MAG: ThuA domain-containing protein, partial [Thermoguttaceae bacterium]